MKEKKCEVWVVWKGSDTDLVISQASNQEKKNEHKNPFLSQRGSDSSLVRVDPVDSIIERFPEAKRPAFDDQHNVDERCQKNPYNSNNERN